MNAPLAEMLRYNRWATLTLVEACRSLSDPQLDAREPGTSGAVRELLLHIVGGQQTFALRTRGRQHEGELGRGSAWPGFDALIAAATASADDLIAIAESLDVDSDVDLPWMGKIYRFPKSFFLVHAVEHGVEHRTEVKVALAQLGIETPDLDGWSYAAVRGFGTEVPE
ncbi:MAG: DinB family protein [Dehalococcoidia bacterium]|nr:DinB family protein [Dehalococcoidia bacterium]